MFSICDVYGLWIQTLDLSSSTITYKLSKAFNLSEPNQYMRKILAPTL